MDLIQENQAPQITFDRTPDISDYPERAVTRLVQRIPSFSSSFAKHALIEYNWDEGGLIAGYDIAPQYVLKASGGKVSYEELLDLDEGGLNFEIAPQSRIIVGEVPEQERCFVCDSHALLKDGGGCGHKLCVTCFTNYCRSRVRGGDIRVHCPFYKCGRYFTFEGVEEVLGEDLLFKLNVGIFNDLVKNRYDLSWCSKLTCSCLIHHQNWPHDLDARCTACGSNFRIKKDGKAILYGSLVHLG